MNIIIFVSVLLVVVIWIFLSFFPYIVHTFYPDFLDIYFVSSRSDHPLVTNNQTKHLISVLEEIKFIPLGIKVEKLPFWGEFFYEINLYSLEERCFASIPIKKDNSKYYFYTLFDQGGIVLTANSGFPASQEESNYIITTTQAVDPQETLNIHRAKVRQLSQAGESPIETFTKESRIEATKAFYAAPITKRRMRIYGLQNLAIMVLFIFLITIILI